MRRNAVTLNLKLSSAAKNSLAAGVELKPGWSHSLLQHGHTRENTHTHFYHFSPNLMPKPTPPLAALASVLAPLSKLLTHSLSKLIQLIFITGRRKWT